MKQKSGWLQKQTSANRLGVKAGFFFAFFAIFLNSCATQQAPQQPRAEDEQEKQRQLGATWAQSIQPRLRLRDDAVISREVLRLGQKLGLKEPAQVLIFSGSVWDEVDHPPVFVLPGHRWYFQASALRNIRFDNELAAGVAAAMALSEVMAQSVFPTVPGPMMGIPQYSREDWQKVNLRMVGLLYSAGIDPRGVPSFWKRALPAKKGVAFDRILELQDEAHAEIARRAPLLNPVVRTPEFGEIEKRLKAL